MMLHNPKQIIHIDASQAAEILGVNPTTVRRWSHKGKIPVIKLPGGRLRYSLNDIEALLSPVILSEDNPSSSNKPLLPSVLSSPTTQQESSDVPLPGFEGK